MGRRATRARPRADRAGAPAHDRSRASGAPVSARRDPGENRRPSRRCCRPGRGCRRQRGRVAHARDVDRSDRGRRVRRRLRAGRGHCRTGRRDRAAERDRSLPCGRADRLGGRAGGRPRTRRATPAGGDPACGPARGSAPAGLGVPLGDHGEHGPVRRGPAARHPRGHDRAATRPAQHPSDGTVGPGERSGRPGPFQPCAFRRGGGNQARQRLRTPFGRALEPDRGRPARRASRRRAGGARACRGGHATRRDQRGDLDPRLRRVDARIARPDAGKAGRGDRPSAVREHRRSARVESVDRAVVDPRSDRSGGTLRAARRGGGSVRPLLGLGAALVVAGAAIGARALPRACGGGRRARAVRDGDRPRR